MHFARATRHEGQTPGEFAVVYVLIQVDNTVADAKALYGWPWGLARASILEHE